MKKLLLFVIFDLLISMSAQAQKIVRVGAFNYYPAIFKDSDGNVKGFYCDALNELGQLENIKFEYVYGSWDEGLTRLKNGEIDLLTSVAITDERLQYMDYSSTPLLTVWSEVYVKPKSEINGILDLNGKTIAIMKSDFNGNYLKDMSRKLGVDCSFIEANDFDEVFKLILDEKVDAGVVNSTFGAPKSDEYGLMSSGIVLNPFEIYLTVKKGNNRDLLKLLNSYLSKWINDRNSILNKSRQKWTYNKVGKIEVFPAWIEEVIMLVLGAVLLLIVFIALLRQRVKAAVNKLNYSERLFATFMDNIPAYVYIKDVSLNHIYSNKRVANINKENSLDNKSSAKTFFEPAVAEFVENSDLEILNSKKEAVDLQYKCKFNGEEVWLHDFKFYIKQPDGSSAIGGISFDITRMKEAELELIKAKEKAEESDRLKSAFLRNISHEIRTPLNGIMGYSKLMKMPNLNNSETEEYSELIIECGDRLLETVNNILDMALIHTNQLVLHSREFALESLISDIYETFAEKAKQKGLSLRYSFDNYTDNYLILTDHARLYQILGNLINNSIKFTMAGEIEFGYEINGDFYEFFVKDTGIGINKELGDRIFQRFSQIEISISRSYEGSGLGLSICKGLVELLGGKIWFESEFGKGTTFYFTLPILKD